MCKFNGCTKQGKYQFAGIRFGYFCKGHAEPSMVYAHKDKQCEHSDCDKRPTFGYTGGKVQFCVTHKIDGMVDVIHKKCEHIDCDKQPYYDFEDGKGRFCAKHKIDGMVDVKHTQCEHIDCDKINPVFDFEGGVGRFCKDHAAADMIDVKNRRCKICPTQATNRKYEGYCYRCFIHTFPDNAIVRNHKTKERTVADFLREQFPKYDISFDRRIQGGCSSRRPDVLIDFGDQVVIVEIDENQHQAYDCSCENKRLMELFQDAGSRPMTMIRFNPDQYKNNKDKSVPSCWEVTKSMGLCKVKDKKQKEWQRRLDTLKKSIEFVAEHGNDKEINVVHLYYDGWSL